MTDISIPRRRGRAAQPVRTSLVRKETLAPDFLQVVTAELPGLDLAGWLAEHRDEVVADLRAHGVLLLRSFAMETAEEFGQAARALTPELLGYMERAAPRHEVAPDVFTSTEFTADQWIPWHHEMSYAHNWPGVLYFFCERPSIEGGATPVAGERVVTPLIPAEVRERFARDGVLYVRNFSPELDLPWQEVFQTADRDEVEAYCAASATEFAWTGRDGLRTTARRQAVATHPHTGETVWFNHAHMFHVSNLPAEVSAALLSEFGTEGLPRNAYYGDGEPIDAETVGLIRDLYRDNAVSFPWQRGDVMVVDNVLATHAREPYAGDRRILVAMSELQTAPESTWSRR